jgi:hypothetical protein
MPRGAIKALGGVLEAVRVREIFKTRVKYSFYIILRSDKNYIYNTCGSASLLIQWLEVTCQSKSSDQLSLRV